VEREERTLGVVRGEDFFIALEGEDRDRDWYVTGCSGNITFVRAEALERGRRFTFTPSTAGSGEIILSYGRRRDGTLSGIAQRIRYSVNIADKEGKVTTAPARGSKTAPWILGAASAGLVAVGALLPWAEITAPVIGSVVRNGPDEGGIATLVMALLSLITVYAGLARGDRTGAVLLPLFGILCALTGVYHFFDLRSGIHAGSIVFSVGPGMYLTVFGGMGLMLSGLWILRAAMGAAKQ
jgi:hypothetical protein